MIITEVSKIIFSSGKTYLSLPGTRESTWNSLAILPYNNCMVCYSIVQSNRTLLFWRDWLNDNNYYCALYANATDILCTSSWSRNGTLLVSVSHSGRISVDILGKSLPNRLISALNYFLWGYLNIKVFENILRTLRELQIDIGNEINAISSHVIQNVMQKIC